MPTFNKFNSLCETIAEKQHNFSSDQLVIALSNTLPVATNSQLSDITQISYAGLSTRNLTTASSSQTSGVYKLKLNDITLTASGTIPTFRYIVIYNDTSVNDLLIGWYDIGQAVDLISGDVVPLDFADLDSLIQIQ